MRPPPSARRPPSAVRRSSARAAFTASGSSIAEVCHRGGVPRPPDRDEAGARDRGGEPSGARRQDGPLPSLLTTVVGASWYSSAPSTRMRGMATSLLSARAR